MVYINVRHTVADYEKWRPFFDGDDARRSAAGASGVNQVYRDADDPNTITIVMEWDNAENARKFLDDPALREVMQQAGVVGMPAVRAVLSRV
ncbi:MAG: putative quinol monooxygenase [Anaerolineales bacterium]